MPTAKRLSSTGLYPAGRQRPEGRRGRTGPPDTTFFNFGPGLPWPRPWKNLLVLRKDLEVYGLRLHVVPLKMQILVKPIPEKKGARK